MSSRDGFVHYRVITRDTDGEKLICRQNRIDNSFSTVAITADGIVANELCRELNILATQLDDALERNIKLLDDIGQFVKMLDTNYFSRL